MEERKSNWRNFEVKSQKVYNALKDTLESTNVQGNGDSCRADERRVFRRQNCEGSR